MTINREQVLEKELYKVTSILNEIKLALNLEDESIYKLSELIVDKLKTLRTHAHNLETQLNNIMYEINTNFQSHNLDQVVNQLFPYMGTDSNGNSVCKDYWQCGQILNDKLKPKTV